MKRILLIIIIVIAVLLNGVALYAVLDSYIFNKPTKNTENMGESEEGTEEDGNNTTAKGDEITIGVSEEVLRQREEAQRQLEEAIAKSEEQMSLNDSFSAKVDDLANPMVDIPTVDFSEFVINKIVEEKIIASKQGTTAVGVIDYEKNEILPFSYESIEITKEGFYIIKQAGKMGILDQDGLEVVDNTYDSMSELISGYFLGKSTDPRGVVTSKIFNRNSDLVFTVDKNIVSVFEENTNYFMFESGGKFGIVDINGEERLKPEYDDLKFMDGKLYFRQGTNIGIIE